MQLIFFKFIFYFYKHYKIVSPIFWTKNTTICPCSHCYCNIVTVSHHTCQFWGFIPCCPMHGPMVPVQELYSIQPLRPQQLSGLLIRIRSNPNVFVQYDPGSLIYEKLLDSTNFVWHKLVLKYTAFSHQKFASHKINKK